MEVFMDFFDEGNKLYNNKDYKKALDYYKLSIKTQGNEACSYYNSGVCFIKLKDYDSALSMLKKAISLQKESKYYFNIGYCYAMKEESQKALINFNLAWALNNQDSDCEKAIQIIIAKIKNKTI